MGIRRISHIVLYVPDPARSIRWYQELLGGGLVPTTPVDPDKPTPVFTQFDASDNDDNHDLAFFPTGGGGQRSGPWKSRFEQQDPTAPKAGLYHVSYQVETREEIYRIKDELERQGRLGNVHEGEDGEGFVRVYGTDYDGLLFEVSWVPPLKRQLKSAHDKLPGPQLSAEERERRHRENEVRMRHAQEARLARGIPESVA
ncbi:VOC family protein [Xanthomonas hyacinthi]|uniref:VOC family protein n=1 Tax=Xanthomonas hyacinthi TaxID=56455 RepID=A0A2S7F0H1_9XANT|nr:VOC family protein [Xanthomonas hyacinthi]PPU98914.1 VOC family protein [Xanthomonas hyacinthi]QGY77749.1 VOC family protein [Xanthomonas hyacinthi]